MTPLLIAEAGSSPAPAWDMPRWAEAAAACKADALKVQMFRASHFPEAEQASKRPLEYPRERLAGDVRTAHNRGLLFGASVFDDEALAIASYQCDFVKLAAREQDNAGLLACFLHAAERAKTGQWFIRSVSETRYARPALNVVTLFTLQQYPASILESLAALFSWARYAKGAGLRWGWSSHTNWRLDCELAASLGAEVIEKHLALTKTDIEAGHSLQPWQFKRMAEALK